MFSQTWFAMMLLLAASTESHIHQNWPPAYLSKYNPLVPEPKRDYGLSAPLTAHGPGALYCKGQRLADHPPAAILTAGKKHNITFLEEEPHSGGSCQVSLSYDEKSYYVIHSWIGGCPANYGSYNFVVPSDAPLGKASFVWTWINKWGAREFYGTCSSVIIEAGNGGPAAAIPFHDRPDIFVAHFDNCPDVIQWGVDVTYPNPGPDVTIATPGGPPFLGCKSVNGHGNSVRSSGQQPVPMLPSKSHETNTYQPSIEVTRQSVTSQPLPTPKTEISRQTIKIPGTTTSGKVSKSSSTLVSKPYHSSKTTKSIAPKTSKTPHPSSTTRLKVSHDMTCGPKVGFRCPESLCCSQYGWCNNNILYCGAGCQPGYGVCWTGKTNLTAAGRVKKEVLYGTNTSGHNLRHRHATLA